MRAALAYAPDDEWPVVDASYEYLWPINQRTWLKATKARSLSEK